MSNLRFSSIHSPKSLTLLFTAIRRPSHNIFGFCVAILAPGGITKALDFVALIVSLLAYIQRLAISTSRFIKVSKSFSFEALTYRQVSSAYSTGEKSKMLNISLT